MITMGSMNKEPNLRTVWNDEARDFTPWLAEQGLELLGNTIGIDLEVVSQEESVGRFKADILCRDTAKTEDNLVVIENQIEMTDHSHLGQILTYGAGLHSTTIVWIAKKFTEEHRAALDWLNEITDERFNFIGLEIELWKIDDSPVAPKFNIVCKPNDWFVRTPPPPTNPDQQLRFDYWNTLKAYLSENSTLKTGKPGAGNWLSIPIGRSGIGIGALAYLKDNIIGASLGMSGPNFQSFYSQLLREKEDIEKELGTKLKWDDSRSTTRSIGLFKNNVDIRDRQNWPDQHKWFHETLEAFYKTFVDRVKNLDADNNESDDSEKEDIIPSDTVSQGSISS
jgi:hypothetical protein